MFSYNHYVPALRWKRAEQKAVRALCEHEKLKLTPLLEIPARRPRPPKDKPPPKRPRILGDWITEMATTIGTSWGTLRFAFAEIVPEITDPSSDDLAKKTEDLFRLAGALSVKLVPVVRPDYSADRIEATKRIVSDNGRGVCFRVTLPQLNSVSIGSELAELLSTLGLRAEDADLIVDLHLVRDADIDLGLICASVPRLAHWRTFTVLGGAYPKGLSKAQPGFNVFPRYEWEAWSKQVKRNLPRKPAFGDYATVHPVPYNPDKNPPPCANIRYTTDSEWRVYKGLPLVPKKPQANEPSRYHQFPAIAERLHVQPFFCGSMYSEGDKYIDRMAKGFRAGALAPSGNSETWLSAALNHHMTYVVIQIDKLFSLSDTDERGNVEGPEARRQQRTDAPSSDPTSRVLLLRPNAPAS